MRPGRLPTVVVCSTLALLCAPGVAAAKVRSATDHLAGVRFTLNARTLTLRLAPQAGHSPPDARKKLQGHRLRASCGRNGAGGTPVATGATFLSFSWARAASTRKVRLPRDISAKAAWCIVESITDGGDVASVDFELGHNPDE